jgi:hypothetical protein
MLQPNSSIPSSDTVTLYSMTHAAMPTYTQHYTCNVIQGALYFLWLYIMEAYSWTHATVQVPKYTQHYACNVFQNALFLVPSVYLRWRCSRFHPERTLVVPQASMEVLTDPENHQSSEEGGTDESAQTAPPERDIFLLFKASCQQPKGFYSQVRRKDDTTMYIP